MSQEKFIIFDMDDVVAQMREVLTEFFNGVSKNGYVHHKDWHTLDCKELYGVDFDPQAMIDEKIIERCEPEADAKETFDKLHEMGFKIVVATARGWHPQGAELTEEWLHKHDLHQDEIHAVSLSGKGKTEVFDKVAQRGRIAGFIDDQDKYLSQSHSHDGVEKTFAMNRPWNLESKAFDHRVDSLTEFRQSVQRHEKKLKNRSTVSFSI